MKGKPAKVIKRAVRRTPTAKLIDVRSSLAKQMLHLVVQFDKAYGHLKVHWNEIGGIPKQEGLDRMVDARQAVAEFSAFLQEFSEKIGFDYCPPKALKDHTTQPKTRNSKNKGV